MTTPAFNPHDASELNAHRRVNGQFGHFQRPETTDPVHLVPLTSPIMPGLDASEAARFRDLDALLEGSGFTADTLDATETTDYTDLCTKIDAARVAGEDGWLPECPFHKDREFPGESDQWGKDFRCHICFADDGRPVSVNRIGLREKAGIHRWATWGFEQHMADLDRATNIRLEVQRRKAVQASAAGAQAPNGARAPGDV